MNSRKIKNYIKSLTLRAGYEIVPRHWRPATQQRPVGNLASFLEDCRTRGFLPRTVFDVGANRSDWSASVKVVFPRADFSLFEPLEEFRPRLETFCFENPGSSYLPVALGAVAGKTEMYVDGQSSLDGSTLWGQVEKQQNQHRLQQGQWRTVVVETLDKLADEGRVTASPDLVKLDVQGFELEVLKGATKALSSARMFLLEVSLFEFWAGQPIFAELVAFMMAHGYVVYDIPGVYRRRLDGALGQVDLAFVPIDSPLRASNLWDPPTS